MDLTDISQQISEWMVNERGIFIFTSTLQDKWLYKLFINHVLYSIPKDKLIVNKYRSDLSHIKSDCIMIDDLSEMIYYPGKSNGFRSKPSTGHLIGPVRERIIEKKSSQIIYTTLYNSSMTSPNRSHFGNLNLNLSGGSSLMYMSDMVGLIYDNHFSIQKLRCGNSEDYKDVDLRILFRDKKIDQILSN